MWELEEGFQDFDRLLLDEGGRGEALEYITSTCSLERLGFCNDVHGVPLLWVYTIVRGDPKPPHLEFRSHFDVRIYHEPLAILFALLYHA